MKKLLSIALLAPLFFLAVSMVASLYAEPTHVPGAIHANDRTARRQFLGDANGAIAESAPDIKRLSAVGWWVPEYCLIGMD